MDTGFAECLRLCLAGDMVQCYRKLTEVLAERPDDLDARFLLSLLASPAAAEDKIADLLDPLRTSATRSGNDYERVGIGLRAAGLEKLASVAFKISAEVDRSDPNTEHAWGDKPFNGQEKRAALFKRLVESIDIGAIVETGTFRGTTTLFMRQVSGVDVYSCEISDRYFNYASTALAGVQGVHLFKSDSRRFLAELGNDDSIRRKTVFFYLDAHWDAGLPLPEELHIIFERFSSFIIMIDDFEVPDRTDFDFDDYGENAVLSADLLAPFLPDGTSLFYPNWPLDGAADARRGFVILASGTQADTIGRLTGDLNRFDCLHALLRQVRGYRNLLRRIAPRLHDLEGSIARARAAMDALPGVQQTAAIYQDTLRAAEAELDSTRQRALDAEARAAKQPEALIDAKAELVAIRQRALDAETSAAALRKALDAAGVQQETMRRRLRDTEVRAAGQQDALQAASVALQSMALRLAAAEDRLGYAEAHIGTIHRSTLWRRTRRLVGLVERFRALRRRPPLETLGSLRRLVFPAGSRRERFYIANFRPIARSFAPLPEPVVTYNAEDPSLVSPDVSLGPLKFIPHDGGFFSNFNFLAGEMYLGRMVYPLFSHAEATRYNKSLKHFAYVDRDCENAWFEFFEPIQYEDNDNIHRDTAFLSGLPDTWGHIAPPEFRVPSATMQLYARDDYSGWRQAVHDVVANKIRPAAGIRASIDRKLAGMPGRRIGVHVRHPSHLVEQGSVFFDTYFQVIDRIRDQYPESSLFLATDNDLAIAAFQQRYGDAVSFYPGFIRQSIDEVLEWAYSLARASSDDMGFVDGVGFQTHYKLAAAGSGSDGLRAGKEAVTDVFTLAACDDFVCTASNFTLTCAFINPRQVQHLVSKGSA